MRLSRHCTVVTSPEQRRQFRGLLGCQSLSLARLARDIAPASLGAVGFEIPWFDRLSTKLFVTVAAVALGMVGAFFFAELSVQRHLLSQVVSESDLLSHTIRNALHRAMLQDRRGDAYLIMQDIGRQTGITRVRMMDQDGRITFSTAHDERGQLVARTAEACSACHAENEPIHRLRRPRPSRVCAAAAPPLPAARRGESRRLRATRWRLWPPARRPRPGWPSGGSAATASPRPRR